MLVLVAAGSVIPHVAPRCAECTSQTRATAGVRPVLNLLVITLDTTRADWIGRYRGSHAAATPHLPLAREGVRFQDATSPSPLHTARALHAVHGMVATETWGPRECRAPGCLDAHAGHSPTGERLSYGRVRRRRGSGPVPRLVPRLRRCQTTTMRSRGTHRKRPHAVRRRLSSVVPSDGLVRPRPRTPPRSLPGCTSTTHTSPTRRPLHSRRHTPGVLDEAAIASIDVQIGRVLAFLDQTGLMERTVIVAIGDHGEALGDHGELTHGLFVYQSVLHVPFIVRTPEAAFRGRRVETAVSSVDLMPTVLDLLGADRPGR